MERLTLKVDGMSCGHCVGAVTKSLSGLKGVQVDKVAVGSATVVYDPAIVSPREISEAIVHAGYGVSRAAA